jgi:hypothetical protein
MGVSFVMQTVASLAANLDGAAVAAEYNKGQYSSWWLYFKLVGVGGWDGLATVYRALFHCFCCCFWLNFYVKCSIKFCMYVDNTKCE